MLKEWRLKQIRFKYKKKLNETNLYLFKSITSYIQNSDLTMSEKEDILQQIMDMMLQTQTENKSMELIIGSDYEKFCKSVVEEYSRDRSKTYIILNYMQKYLFWLILISSFMAIFRWIINPSLGLGITVDMFLMLNVISLILIPATKKSRQETASITSFYQRYYTMSRGLGKTEAHAFGLMIVIFGLLRFSLGKIIDPRIFSYTISIYTGIPYIIIILAIIGAIEAYKQYTMSDR